MCLTEDSRVSFGLSCYFVVVSRFFFFQAEDGIRDLVRSRGLGDVYKRQILYLMSIIGDLLPDGVLNVVNGFGVEAGKPLASSNRIKKIAFTGETTTGRLIMQYASENLIPVTLEPVSYTHLRAHETVLDLVCRLLLEKKQHNQE